MSTCSSEFTVLIFFHKVATISSTSFEIYGKVHSTLSTDER